MADEISQNIKKPFKTEAKVLEKKTPSKPNYYAALDLGTNNCRLLIAKRHFRRSFSVVDSFSKIVCLGEGVEASKMLSEAAMNRAIKALLLCQKKIKAKHVVGQKMVATHACRQASNSELFIQRVKKETGLTLEIISQQEEARLGVMSCCDLIEKGSRGVILFDIGGGSCEISLLDCSEKKTGPLTDRVKAWISIPIGIITLVEQFCKDYHSRESFHKMKSFFKNYLEQFQQKDSLGALIQADNFYLLGISGTVTTLAGLHLNLKRYDRHKVDGLWLLKEDVDAMIEKMLILDKKAKIGHPCIGKERAEYIVAGCAILEAIRDMWPAPRLRVADRGLREGILLELIEQDKEKFFKQKGFS